MVKSTPSNQPAALQASMHRIAADVTALTKSLTASISEVENNQKNSDDSLKSSINAVKCDLEKTNEAVTALKDNIAALECSIASSLESVECNHQTTEEPISKPSKHDPAEVVQDQHMGFANAGASLHRIDAGVEVPQDSLNHLVPKHRARWQKHRAQIQSCDTQIRTLQDEVDEGFCAPLRPRADLAPDTSRPVAVPSLQRAHPLGAHFGATSSIRSSPIPQSSSVPVYLTEAFNRFIAENEEVVKNLFASDPDAKHVENAELAEKTPEADCVDNLAALQARIEARFAELELKVNQTEATGAVKAPDRTINTLEVRIANLETTIGNFAEKHAQDSHASEGLVDLATAKHIEARIAALEDMVSNITGNYDDKFDAIERRLSKPEINAGDTSEFVALESRTSDITNLLGCDIGPSSPNREATTGLVPNHRSHVDESTLVDKRIKAIESDIVRIQTQGQSTPKTIQAIKDSFHEDIRYLYDEVEVIEVQSHHSAEQLENLRDEIAGLKQKDQSSAEKLKALESRVAESESRSKVNSKAMDLQVGQVDITNSRDLDHASIPSIVVVEHEKSNFRDSEAPAPNVEVEAELNSNVKYRTNIPPVIVKPNEHLGVDGLNARFKKLSIFDAVASHLASYNHHDACGLIIAEQKRHVTVTFDLTKEKKPHGCDSRRSDEPKYDGCLKIVRQADMLTIERFGTAFHANPHAYDWLMCRYYFNSLGEWNLCEWMGNCTAGRRGEPQWLSSANTNPQKAQCLKAIEGIVEEVVGMMRSPKCSTGTPVVLVT